MRTLLAYIALLALVAAFVTVLLYAPPIGAQERGELTESLALARLCANESGLRAYTFDDCIGIDAVIRFRAEFLYRSTYLEALHRASGRVTIDRRRAQSHRPWIVDLWPDRREPAGYCPTCSWDVGGPQWGRTYQHAVEIRRGAHSVPWAVHTWAAPGVRPEDPTAYTVVIGETVNDFWTVPAYLARWGV